MRDTCMTRVFRSKALLGTRLVAPEKLEMAKVRVEELPPATTWRRW